MIAIMTGDHPHNYPNTSSVPRNEWDQYPPSHTQIQAMDGLNLTNYEHEILNLKIGGMINFIIILVSLFVGAAAMSSLEGWSFSEACYWSAVTVTSVGNIDQVVLGIHPSLKLHSTHVIHILLIRYSCLLFKVMQLLSSSLCVITHVFYFVRILLYVLLGYGDLVPNTDGGKIFTIFFAIFGCLMTVKGFSEMVRLIIPTSPPI